MKLTYAVERLYEVGWEPDGTAATERLPDGRLYPTVEAIRREFAVAGLGLSVTHHPDFNCSRATWAPLGHRPDGVRDGELHHGTVVGACDREAAVYALAQLLAARATEPVAV